MVEWSKMFKIGSGCWVFGSTEGILWIVRRFYTDGFVNERLHIAQLLT